MARQLIVFCDGTNNTLTGGARDTSVLRLYEWLAEARDPRQRLYYDPGVGSPDAYPSASPSDWLRAKWQRAWGLASGEGVYDNIAQAYAFLMREWRPGDEVWLFGFSRGAFTARAVSGMVNLFGIVEPHHEAMLPLLLRVYFTPTRHDLSRRWRHAVAIAADAGRRMIGIEPAADSARTRDEVAQQIRRAFTSAAGQSAGVRFVGVWDTVASVGLPGLSRQITSEPTIAGKRIAHVRHALALDEHRLPFRLRLYVDDEHGSGADAQSMRQRWFRGAHADIGGGLRRDESALPDRALAWMIDEAAGCGLVVPATPPPPASTGLVAHDELYVMPWWALGRMQLRDTRVALRGDGSAVPIATSADASAWQTVPSVWQRLRSQTPLALALGGIAVFAVLHGALLGAALPPLRGPADALAQAGVALERGAELATVQALMPAALMRGDAAALWGIVGTPPRLGAALVADAALALSLAYVLARATTWAYARAAGQRRPGEPVPAWSRLGRALHYAFFGDLVENLGAWCAIGHGSLVQGLGSVIAGVGAVAKWAGLAGCAALIVVGLVARRRD